MEKDIFICRCNQVNSDIIIVSDDSDDLISVSISNSSERSDSCVMLTKS